jgi:hypothetical protein
MEDTGHESKTVLVGERRIERDVAPGVCPATVASKVPPINDRFARRIEILSFIGWSGY